ncbi:hypothetical protein C8J57DRAFT_1229671 [Mycena rebaudengoi]|nr:hypothetical protein C8J57DRAFT_1229671 [Mycena rebaudengoi]
MSDIASTSQTQVCSISSGVTFVINTQGPGPFTFNINLSGHGSSPVSFTLNTEASSTTTTLNPGSKPHGRSHLPNYALQSSPTTPLARKVRRQHGHTAQWSGKSQTAEAAESPREDFDPSDTESEMDSEADATFSPNNQFQLVTPSRKRKLDRMECEVHES